MKQEDQKIRSFGDGSDALIGALIEVHTALGPGLLESAYEACVRLELRGRGFAFERQVPVMFVYRGEPIDGGYRLDFVVEGRFIVEVKAVEQLLPVHSAQVLTYMKVTGIPVGFLVNFNVPSLRRGLRRFDRRPPQTF